MASALAWAPVRVLDTHADDCVSETVDVARAGPLGWLAVWDVSCDPPSPLGYRLRIGTSETGREWHGRRSLPEGFDIRALRSVGGQGLHVYGRGRVLVLGVRPPGRSAYELDRVLEVARLDADGLARRRELDGGHLLYGLDGDIPLRDTARPVMSLARGGRGVAVWARLVEGDAANPVGQVYARVRNARGRFEPAEPLGTPGQPSALAVDVNDHGDAALAWCQDRADVLLRTRRADGDWTASERLGRCSDINELDVALDDAGRLAVTWASTRQVDEPRPHQIAQGVRVAVGRLGGALRTRALSSDGEAALVIVLGNGTALIAWSGPYSGPTRGVRFARVDARGVRSSGAVAGHKHRELIDLESGLDGRGLLLWRARGAAFFIRPVDRRGRLGRREAVYRADSFEGHGVLEAANLGIDPANRDAVAIWSHVRHNTRGFPRRSTVEAASN